MESYTNAQIMEKLEECSLINILCNLCRSMSETAGDLESFEIKEGSAQEDLEYIFQNLISVVHNHYFILTGIQYVHEEKDSHPWHDDNVASYKKMCEEYDKLKEKNFKLEITVLELSRLLERKVGNNINSYSP